MNERLEEIKDRYMKREYDYALSSMDIDWLIQQAERVEELEKHNLEYFDMHKKLKIRNKHYRDALIYVMKTKIEQYHDPKNMLEDLKWVVGETLKGESE